MGYRLSLREHNEAVIPRSLYTRLAVSFAAILLCFGAVLGVVSYRAARTHQQEVMQALSRGLAAHIVTQNALNSSAGVSNATANELFHMLMAVNPSIEVYLLDADGRILMHSAPDGHVLRSHVSLAPIRNFLAGGHLPILGDNPRNPQHQSVFSVAPLAPDGEAQGYLYVVLAGEAYMQMSESAGLGYALSAGLWLGLAVLGLALAVGLVVFRVITQRVNVLVARVEAFARAEPLERVRAGNDAGSRKDEIGRLSEAFGTMAQTISEQMTEIKRQDELRRELVANVSHDLRTPLTSMQNYLETMLVMEERLSAVQRREYLERAVRQSRGVARLSQQLFELARLECEEVQPKAEQFCAFELTQDIAHKMEFPASERGVHVQVAHEGEPKYVSADIGMIERVITNLIDNAIRCTSPGGEVRLETIARGDAIEIRVSDTGIGIAPEHLPYLFDRDSPLRRSGTQRNAGLGLLIVKRILALHDTKIAVESVPGRGTQFRFVLKSAKQEMSVSEKACV